MAMSSSQLFDSTANWQGAVNSWYSEVKDVTAADVAKLTSDMYIN
jgi:hypothetical protein